MCIYIKKISASDQSLFASIPLRDEVFVFAVCDTVNIRRSRFPVFDSGKQARACQRMIAKQFYDEVTGSPIKTASPFDRFRLSDTAGAHFNLVGGGFHRVLEKLICCGKDYSDQSTHKQD